MSHDSAILTTFEAVIDTLEEVRDSEGRADHKVGHMASSLIEYLLSKRFIMTAICFRKVFDILEPVNKLLQEVDLNLLAAVNAISDAKKLLKELRKNENTFDDLIKEVNQFILNKNELIFSELKILRNRRIKKMSGEMTED